MEINLTAITASVTPSHKAGQIDIELVLSRTQILAMLDDIASKMTAAETKLLFDAVLQNKGSTK